MKSPGGKFRELQKYWYKILEESGFRDIEKLIGDELVLKQNSDHNGWFIDQFTREMNEEYFRTICEIVGNEDTVFRNDIDKIIMNMHAYGAKIINIVNTLKANNMTRNRASVRFIIRRYEIDWGLKQYTLKQLNKKPL